MPFEPEPCAADQPAVPPCCSPAIASTGLCLADGTPIAVLAVSECADCGAAAAGPQVSGWMNLLTGAYTPGPPPAGAEACTGQPQQFQVGQWCDLDAEGNVIAPVLVEYEYDDAGQLVDVRTLTPGGEPYDVAGTLGLCPSPTGDAEYKVLCDTLPDGTVVRFLRAYYPNGDGTSSHDDTDLDGAAYLVGGTVGVCADCDITQVCVRPSGRVEFITNPDADTSGEDADWRWSPSLAGPWWPTYRLTGFPGWTTVDGGTAEGQAHWVAPHPGGGLFNTGLPGEGPDVPAPPGSGDWYVRAAFTLPDDADPDTIRISSTALNADQLAVEWRLNGGPWQPVGAAHFDPAYVLPPTQVPGAQAGVNEIIVHVRETVPAGGAAGLLLHVIAEYDVTPGSFVRWTRVVCDDGASYYVDEAGVRHTSLPEGWALVGCPDGPGGACCPAPVCYTPAPPVDCTGLAITGAAASVIASAVVAENPQGWSVAQARLDTTFNHDRTGAGGPPTGFGVINCDDFQGDTGVAIDYLLAAPADNITAFNLFNAFGAVITDDDGIGSGTLTVYDAANAVLWSGPLVTCKYVTNDFDLPCTTDFGAALDGVARIRIANLAKWPPADAPNPDIGWREVELVTAYGATLTADCGGQPVTATIDGAAPGLTYAGGQLTQTSGPHTLTFHAPAGMTGTIVTDTPGAFDRLTFTDGTVITVTGDGTVGFALRLQPPGGGGVSAGVATWDPVTGLPIVRDANTGAVVPGAAIVPCAGGSDEPGLPGLAERDALVLCNTAADGTVTQFVRDYQRSETGAIIGHTDYLLDGSVYDPPGTVGVCEPCEGCQTLLLCDEGADEAVTIRGAGVSSGTLSNGVTWETRGTGSTGVPGSGTPVTSGVDTPDGAWWNRVYSFPNVAVAPQRWTFSAPSVVEFSVYIQPGDTSPNGGKVQLPAGVEIVSLPQGYHVDPATNVLSIDSTAGNTCSDLTAPNKAASARFRTSGAVTSLVLAYLGVRIAVCGRFGNWAFGAFDVIPTGQFLRTICRGCDGQVASVTDTRLDGETLYAPLGAVVDCGAGSGADGWDVETQVLCDVAADGTSTPFVRHYRAARETGAPAGYSDTTLDGQTAYLPAGEVGQCLPVDCTTVPICVRPSGTVEFISNADNVTTGAIDQVWKWSSMSLAGPWYDMYQVGVYPGWTAVDAGTPGGTAHWVAPHPNRGITNTGLPNEGPTFTAANPEWYARASFTLPDFADPATIKVAATILNADQLAVEWRLNAGPWQAVNRAHNQPAYTLLPTTVPGAQAGVNELFVHVRETVFNAPAAGVIMHLIVTYDVAPDAYEAWARVTCTDGTTYYLDAQGARQESIPAGWQVVPCPGGTGGNGFDVETWPLCVLDAAGQVVGRVRREVVYDSAGAAVEDRYIDPATGDPAVLPPGATLAVCPADSRQLIERCGCDDTGTGIVRYVELWAVDPSGATSPELVGTWRDGDFDQPYAPVNPVDCPTGSGGGGSGVDVESWPLCVLDASGAVIQAIRREVVYDDTGAQIEARYVDAATGDPVALPGGTHIAVCPVEQADSRQLIERCGCDNTPTGLVRYVELWAVDPAGATPPALVGTWRDGDFDQPYSPVNPVDCPTGGGSGGDVAAVRPLVEQCGCDDVNGDGSLINEYVELWAVDTTGGQPPELLGAYLDGDLRQPYVPANPVPCTAECPGAGAAPDARQIIERCGCDDVNGDGSLINEYVELWAVDTSGARPPELLGAYLDGDLRSPYSPANPVPCTAECPGEAAAAPVLTGARALTGTGTADLVAEFPGLQSVTLMVSAGSVLATLSDGAAVPFPAGTDVTWSVNRERDSALAAASFTGADPATAALLIWTYKA